MSHSHDPTDAIDQLLAEHFDAALGQMSNMDLTGQVMARIRRQQRVRFITLVLTGLIATAICVISGLPLIGLLSTALSSSGPVSWWAELPSMIVVTMVLLGVGWLFLLAEETV